MEITRENNAKMPIEHVYIARVIDGLILVRIGRNVNYSNCGIGCFYGAARSSGKLGENGIIQKSSKEFEIIRT